VIVTRRETPVSNLAQFRGRQVGVVEGEATQELERSYPNLRYVRYGSIAQALKDLSAGRIEAVVDSLGMVIYHMDRLGLTNLRISGCTPFVHDICLGVRKDRPLLASALDKAVASITEREKATIKQRWLVQDHRGDGWVSWRLAGICGAAMAAAIAAVVGWGWHLKRGIAERLRTERVLAEYARQLERQASLKATAASIGAELQQAAGPREMARRLLDRMAPLLGADCALFYASERDGTLLRQACGYGVREDVSDTGSVPVGQGLVGQCALEKKRIVVAPPAAGTMRITWGSGSARPAVLLLQPVLQGGRLLGVMEFGALGAFAPDHEGILDELLPIIGMNLEIQYNNECRHSSEHCRGLLATLPQC
ncbi:MAG TPA: transporter substrate-binding domain-containing protein, partial [Desulfuromonadaceae bacterium]